MRQKRKAGKIMSSFNPLPAFGLTEDSSNADKKRAAFDFIHEIGYMIIGTTAMDGKSPTARGLELHYLDGEDYFYLGVAKGKPVCHELMRYPYLVGCVTQMTVKDLAMAVRLNAHVTPVRPEDAPAVYEEYWRLNPGTKALYRKDLDLFRIFRLDSGEGEIFHLPEEDEIARVRFTFGGASPRPWAYEISGRCVGCGVCAEACMRAVIHPNEHGTFYIDHFGCLECGRCHMLCPNGAIDCNSPFIFLPR